MISDAEQTQASDKPSKLTCPADKCGHKLANEKNLATHMSKFHEGLQLGVQAVRNLFTSPRPGPSSAATPSQIPAKAPSISPTPKQAPRQLLFDKETDSQLRNEEEVLQQAAKEEEELYRALETLRQNPFDPVTEDETKQDIKEKLKRFKEITTKKTELQVETGIVMKNLKDEMERLKADAVLREQVVETQLKELDEKDKSKETLAKEVKALKDTIKEKDKFIKELEEATEAEDDGSNEVEEVPQNTIMNKELTGHQCNACDKRFRKSNDLDNHIDAKHTEK